MSELEILHAEIAAMHKVLMDIKGQLGELIAKAHSPQDCKLNERIAVLERQQNRWLGGLTALVALAGVLGAVVAVVVNKVWR